MRILFFTELVLFILIAVNFSACDKISDRLSQIGKEPGLKKVKIYENEIDPFDEVVNAKVVGSRFDIAAQHKSNSYNNTGNSNNSGSLWPTDSRDFFSKHRIGDIVSVMVSIQDQAQLNNQTQKGRQSKSNVSAPLAMGMESIVDKVIPGEKSSANSLIDLKGNSNSIGQGKIDRKEVVQTTIAATVIKILPSGQLIIKGSQEVRINYEVRVITIEGIVRPVDISADNIVKLEKIAEARVSYGGRGHISEYQQDQYGKQLLDIISPF